ncbi:MAG: zinc metallopeptidase [Akkermansia sp.]|nr:zinc metallopeptidase [Akkermansia sp.]MBQ7022536.1 zinc metallopeptidase [Akkermansia sp.]
MTEQLFTILAQYAPYYGEQTGYMLGPGMGTGMYGGASVIGIGLILLAGLVGGIVQSRMQASMRQYSAEPAPLTGAQVARRMLAAHGLHDVQVTHTPGALTDHYNPVNRTVNLSDTVYAEATVAAMAVAAHECGHAVQHARNYAWLTLRSELVPLVNIGSRLGQIVLILGLILVAMGTGTTVAWIGLALFATTTVFALVTLPVEFDASRRALAWMQSSGLANSAMHGQAGTALRWAAMTYVAAALSSIAMLVYYVLILLNARSRNE